MDDEVNRSSRPGPVSALIIRDSDKMRTGIQATLASVAVAAIELRTPTQLDMDEQIKIQLENIVQRFKREVRGAVRSVSANQSGEFEYRVELFTRLTPLDVSLLKMGLRTDSEPGGTKWV